MATEGGPIHPFSAIPIDAGKTFGLVLSHTSGVDVEGLGVTDATTLTADVIWRLAFKAPPVLPSGTFKLSLDGYANGATGNILVNPKWIARAEGEALSTAKSAEGATTIAFTSTSQYVNTLFTLDASTAPAANDWILMDLTFEDTSTTLAVDSLWIPMLIWE